MNKATYSITLLSPPDTLNAVHGLLNNVWEKSPEVNSDDQIRFETALIELVGNVFRHADNGDGVSCSLNLNITDMHIEAQLCETGEPGAFKLIDVAMPDGLAESGRGIALIQAITDEFTYERQGEFNIWRIVRKLTSANVENRVANTEVSRDETNFSPLTPLIKLDDQEELQLHLARLPQLLRHLFNIEKVFIKFINGEGKWVHNEDGKSVIENRTGGKISDFTLMSDEIVTIADLELDPRILAGTIRNDTPEIKAYIGRSIVTKEGTPIGVLAAWSTKPRIFTSEELEIFDDIVFWLQRHLVNSRELDRAQEIQIGLLPKPGIEISGYELAGFCQPHFSVGGDFYDWIETPNGLSFTLADVMGKGIGASIMAATVRATIRTASWDHGVEKVMAIATRVLETDLQDAGSFVTLVHGQLDTFLNHVRFVDAGHGYSAHVTKDGTVTRVTTSNYPIGAGHTQEWEVLSVAMAPGDTLFMGSDGMAEAFAESQDSRQLLIDIAAGGNNVETMLDRLKEIVSHAVSSDDVTMLVLRRS